MLNRKPQRSQDLFESEEQEQEWEFVDMDGALKTVHSMDASEVVKAVKGIMAIDEENMAIDQENTIHTETIVREFPSTAEHELFPSSGFESERINIDEIIAGLVSQIDSQHQNLACDAIAEQANPIDPKTLSADELILTLNECHNRVDELVTAIKTES